MKKAGRVVTSLPLALAAVLHNAACTPTTSNMRVFQNVRPDPSSQPVKENQKKDEIEATAKVEGNAVTVVAKQFVMCRQVKSQAMIGDSETEHSLTPEARTFQWILGGTAVVGGILGGIIVGSKCTMPQKDQTGQDLTDSSGQPVMRPCTSSESKQQLGLGWALIGVGAAAGGVFAANAIRASDSQERGVPANPQVTTSEWSKCSVMSAGPLEVSLKFSGGTLQATSNMKGVASFDFAGLTAPSDIDRNSTADILIADKKVGQVELANLALFPEWKAKLESERAVAATVSATREAEQRKEAGRTSSNSEVIQAGRTIVTSQLKAPSTASFVSDSIVFSCPSGTYATVHEVDAQNGFGAMIRSQACAVFNMQRRRTTIQPNLCYAVNYTSRNMRDSELCSNWDNIIENASFTGASF